MAEGVEGIPEVKRSIEAFGHTHYGEPIYKNSEYPLKSVQIEDMATREQKASDINNQEEKMKEEGKRFDIDTFFKKISLKDGTFSNIAGVVIPKKKGVQETWEDFDVFVGVDGHNQVMRVGLGNPEYNVISNAFGQFAVDYVEDGDGNRFPNAYLYGPDKERVNFKAMSEAEEEAVLRYVKPAYFRSMNREKSRLEANPWA